MPRKTIKQLQAEITATNKQFARLPLSLQRVEIARDVIAQLEQGKFQATQGTYVELPKKLTKADLKRDASLVFAASETCTVCGIGGLFVSAVCKADKLPVIDLGTESGSRLSVQGVDSYEYLKQFFPEKMLANIEGAFEQRNDFGGEWGCQWFAEDVDDDNDRLRLIMENIIVNDGEFLFENSPESKTVWYTPNFAG